MPFRSSGASCRRKWTRGPEHQGVNMQKVGAVLGSALFFVVAPCVLAGLIPWWMTRWEFGRAFFGLEITRAVGVLLILVAAAI